MTTSYPIETSPAIITQTRLYDLTALREMVSGNTDFVLTLVKIFIDTVPANSSELLQASHEGNWDMVSKLAHKLKSTVDMMRMSQITQDIRTLELDAKNLVNKEYLPALAKKVDEVIQASAKQLASEFNL